MPATHTAANQASTWLHPTQIEQLRTACYDDRFHPPLQQRNEVIVALLYDTGLRVGELVQLDVDHLNLNDGKLHPPTAEQGDTQTTDTSQRTPIALDPCHSLGTVRLLRSYLYNRRTESSIVVPSRKGGRLTTKAIRDVLTKAAEISDIQPYTPTGRGDSRDVSPQTLRHSTAWRLLNDEERSIVDVSERLRHTEYSTTRNLYAHFNADPADSTDSSDSGESSLADQLMNPGMVDDVLDTIPDLMYVFDTNGRMRWWNDRVSAVTGYTDADIATMHPLEFLPDDDTPRLAEAISHIVDRKAVEVRESHLVTRSGEHIPYEFSGAPLTDEEGDVWGIVGAGRDISARKQAEREQERFDLFVDAVTEYAIFLLDPNGRIVSWNRGAQRIKGYREEEVVGEHFSILYPGEAIENDLPERLLERAAAEGSVVDEGWRVRKDDSRFWAHVTITARYDEGELLGFAKVTRDMTERRQREREIQRQRDELQQLNRINTVIRTIDQALVQASDRPDIEQAVCDQLTAVDAYVGAWIGDRQTGVDTLTPRARAGIDEAVVDRLPDSVIDGASSNWPPRRALQTGEVHVAHEPVTGPAADGTSGSPSPHERVVTIAVPIRHRETVFGVLVIYATDPAIAGERHETVLAELGETIGLAITASERREALITDSVLELEFDIRDPDQFFVQATTRPGASLSLNGIAGRDDTSYLEYFTATNLSATELRAQAEQIEQIDHLRVVDHTDTDCLCEVRVTGPSVVTTVAESGGTVTDMTAENGRGSVTVEIPRTVVVSRVIDALEVTVADVELQAKRTVDRPLQTERRFQSTVDDRLTDKQRDALETAYLAGFFEQPRLSTGEEIADSLDVSPSTFHQHIRVGLRKLLAAIVENSPNGSRNR